MTKTLRLLLATATIAAALSGAASALACGNSGGYSYAGVGAPQHAFGVSAVISPLNAFDILDGHVAGWVGVGGPGEGPNGSNEWIQVGYAGFSSITGSDIYYEVARPGSFPAYHEVSGGLAIGTVTKVSVVEMYHRANWWRVWVNHRPVTAPIYLPASHGAWSPIATAESWDGTTNGSGPCNTFLYRFRRVMVAHGPGGNWHPLTGGFPIQSASTKIQRARGSAGFLAAEGRPAFQLIGATS